jgi:Immunoglobulin-like domain of bacterial spore germination/Sporulation and spore germination
MGMSVDDERFRRDEELLRQALHEQADDVLPSLDALSNIRRRTSRPPLWRRPVVLGMAAASVTALAVIIGSSWWLGGSSDDTTATGSDSSPSPTTAQSPTPSVAESARPPTSTETIPPPPDTGGPQPDNATVPVYYVTETTQGWRLAREFQNRPTPDGVISAAVTTMLAEPALDSDYQSFWQADTQLQGVEVKNDVIEVNLTGHTDYTGVRDDVAEISVQQLVYTVTAAASVAGDNGALPVQILVDGEPPDQMWGRLDLSDPIGRAPLVDVWQHVQINNPQDGATMGRPVKIDGVALAAEGTLYWQVFDDEGNIVEEDFTTTSDASTFSEFAFEVDLEPGIYSVVVMETDQSGGAEGPGPMSDTKNFSVR